MDAHSSTSPALGDVQSSDDMAAPVATMRAVSSPRLPQSPDSDQVDVEDSHAGDDSTVRAKEPEHSLAGLFSGSASGSVAETGSRTECPATFSSRDSGSDHDADESEEASLQKRRKKSHAPTDSERLDAVCANCGTTQTVRWRISSTGENACNACGIYERSHGVPRPIEMVHRDMRRRERVVAAYLRLSESGRCKCTCGGCHHHAPPSS